MPRVNKKSLREEFDALKGEFKRLSSHGKMTAESRALFNALLMLFEVMLAVFMEKTTGKDNTNSSIPPSQTQKDETVAPHPGSKSKGKAQNDALAGNTRTRETIQIAKLDACEICGEDLSDTACQGHERRTRIDIVFEKVVIHVDAEIKDCPACDAHGKGRFPADMSGPMQYGAGVKAYILNLLIAHMLSLNRL